METRLDDTLTQSRTATNEKLVDDIKDMIHRAEDKAKESAKAADKMVREHPYQTIGIAFGIGLLIGVLAARRK